MLTLQSTFQYGQSTDSPPVEYADVVLGYPQLSLAGTSSTISSANGNPTLLVTGHETISFGQRLTNKRYSLTVPTSNIFGQNYGKVLQAYLTGLLRINPHPSLSAFSLDFQAHFSSSTDDPYLMQTLFFFQNLRSPPTTHSSSSIATPASVLPPALTAPANAPRTNNAAPTDTASTDTASAQLNRIDDVFPTPDSHLNVHNRLPHVRGAKLVATPDIILDNGDSLNQVVDANIFLINKQSYLAMLKQLFPTIAPENESILLYMISALVTLNETVPRLSTDSEAAKKKLIQNVLTSFNQSDPQGTIYTTLTQDFAKLFDIPIIMPVFKLLTIAGSLRFRNAPNVVPFADLNFFHLSAEYSVAATERLPEPIVSHYVWDKNTFQNNIATFRYQDLVIQSRVQYPVRIRVKAYDQSDVYVAEFDPSDPKLQALSIVIDLRLPPGLEPNPVDGGSIDIKIRGKVVALTKECKLSGTVIVQAKKTDQDPWTVVGSGTSDQAGNFNLVVPSGKFKSAQALVSLDPYHQTLVAIDSSGSISSDFLYILLQRDESDSDTIDTPASDQDSKDCTCEQGGPARLPSQSDLIQSNQFTQDVGGCVSLTIPNRILREYSYRAVIRESDPDVASYTLRSWEDESFTEHYDLTTNSKLQRGLVDFDNPIKWQDGDEATTTDLTIYQSVTVSTGVILHYRSEFRADGYSLGDLLYSLPLAPGQKKQVVTIEAAHSLLGSENQNLSQTDALTNNLLNERAIVDQIAGNIGESLRGQSSSSTSGVSAGLGAAGSVGFLGASLGVSGGYSNSNSSASQDSKRGVSQYFSEILRQNILQNTSDYRNLSATAVTSVQEGQSYDAQTDVVANHNHCHAMTMLYFEVLRHFAVFQELSDAEECVFVPLLMTKFTTNNVGKWADILARRLLQLSANTWILPKTVNGRMQHSLIPAFDANERVRTQWSLVDFPAGTYDTEPIIDIQGTMTLKVSLPRPKTHYDFILSFPITLQTKQVEVTDFKSIANAARDAVLSGGLSFLFGDQGSETREVQVLQRAKVLDNFITIDDTFQTVPPAQCLRVIKFDQFTVDGKTYDPMKLAYLSPIDSTMWASFAHLLGFVDSTKSATQQLLEYYFQGQLISDWDTIWNRTIVPEVYKSMLADIGFDFAAIQITTLDNYNGGQRTMTAYLNGTANNKTRKDIQTIKIASQEAISNTTAGVPIGSLVDLRTSPVLFDLLTLRLNYSTEHYHGTLFSGALITDLLTSNPQPFPTPERAEEKRDPRKDDVYLANRLLQHLNSNLEYYNRVLWSGLDRERRYMLLDGFKIETYDKFGASEGFRSLASILKNDLVSIVGNSLVFPVAPGYKVSQALVVRSNGEHSSTQALLDFYRPEIPPPPYRISVPTRGVYAEALMGACDSCESVKPDSSQDWTKFTTDEPTPINAITAPVPTVSQFNPNFKDFAQPLVQVQNAPAAPDPGLGLAAVTALLGKSDIFKDVTGLDQNQKNAIEAFNKTQDNAKAFAQMASAMVTQAHNTEKTGQIMSSIENAQKSGNLSKEEAGKLVKDHIQQQIDGGATLKAELDQNKNAGKASLTDAAVSAAEKQGAAVKATKTSGSDGSVSESVDISPMTGSATSRSSKVQGPVPKIQQSTDSTCWAAAATMMLSWLERRTVTQEEAMSRAGPTYLAKFKANSGLKASEKDAFLGALGMVSEPPATYRIETYMQWIEQYGPLWITIDAAEDENFSPHAKVLIRIDSDDVKGGTNTFFTFLNPATAGDEPERVKFEDFEKSFEQVAIDNRSTTLFNQVVHFAADVSKGEGFMIEGRWPHLQSPVHENMTLAALMASDFALDKSTTVGKRPDINEFNRGNIWPDDPQNLLFKENATNNWDKSLGLEWGIIYELNIQDVLLNRSHKGDLQFLHSMSSSVGENPQDTLAKLKLWSEVLYKLSIGVIDSSDRLTSISVTTQSPSKTYDMSTVFGANVGGVAIKAAYSLNTLLASDTKYVKLDMRRRALGTLLHTVQDSYSHSHCRRTLLNPGDVTNLATAVTPLEWQFKQGTRAKFGAVENFHTYTGQDDKRHALYDSWPPQKMKASDPSSFDGLLGGRDAIEKCTKLVNFWYHKTDWDNGPKQLIYDEIWVLAQNVTPGDNTVD